MAIFPNWKPKTIVGKILRGFVETRLPVVSALGVKKTAIAVGVVVGASIIGAAGVTVGAAIKGAAKIAGNLPAKNITQNSSFDIKSITPANTIEQIEQEPYETVKIENSTFPTTTLYFVIIFVIVLFVVFLLKRNKK